MSISKIRENARTALAGKWGKGACIVLAYFALAILVGIIVGAFGEESLLGSIIDLAFSIVQVPIAFGLSYAFIKLKRDEEVKAFDFLSLGFANFGRAWKIGLREVLKVILPLIVFIIALVMIVYASFAASAAVMLGESAGSSLGIMALGFILYLVSIIWLVVRSLLYSLTVYVAYDNPNMSSLEVVNESERMMKGNRGKIFLLSLSFIGWAILALFTLGIGYFWLMPYMVVAEVCFYEYLLGKKSDNNSEAIQSDNGESNIDPISEN